MKKPLLFLFAAGLFLYGCSSSKETAKTEAASAPAYANLTPDKMEDICADVANSLDCARKVEDGQIKKYSSLVKRDGTKLTLKSEDKTPIVLTDKDGAYYNFLDYWSSIGYYLVLTHSYESFAYQLINAETEKSYSISGFPVLSPDQERIAAMSLDLEAGYLPNGIQIWQVKKKTLEMEYSINPTEWGPSDPAWSSPTSIKFKINTPQEDYSMSKEDAVLTKNGKYWSIKK